jgi:hypothetical protein
MYACCPLPPAWDAMMAWRWCSYHLLDWDSRLVSRDFSKKVVQINVRKRERRRFTYDFFSFLDTGLNFGNVSLGFIVKKAGLDLVFAEDGEVLFDRELALAETLAG